MLADGGATNDGVILMANASNISVAVGLECWGQKPNPAIGRKYLFRL